jgi:hypothetical protein
MFSTKRSSGMLDARLALAKRNIDGLQFTIGSPALRQGFPK